ncbi:MAG: NAD(P)-dependent alcohol dehydrogenase [Acidobacteria bacterium]|jgi:NADPH:quinone reductase-like Zn-dependent oxidoreductase|nr:NAD(P)-dependent alcohol dehydrogenase [Acidobacteriota bacterium]
MRAWQIQDRFGLDALTLVEREEPRPGPGQVAVQVRATSLNYRDLLTVVGSYNPKQPLPLVPLSDGAGLVSAVGPGVTRVREGDRVAGIFNQAWISGPPRREHVRSSLGGPLDGLLAEQVVLGAEGVVRVPEHLSLEEAACLPCAGVTAWNALVEQGGLTAGQTLLVLGTGGVALFALQLARCLDARVIVMSSSDAKLKRARELGASETVNYRTTPDWDRQVKELTGGVGVDHVLELGGAETLPRSLRAVRVGGHVSLVGSLSGLEATLNLALVFMRGVRLQGVLVGSRDTFDALNRVISRYRLRPVIDRVFAFEDAPAAFEHLQSQGHLGKVVVRVA